MVVRVHDRPGRVLSRKLGGSARSSNRLSGRERSLYFAAGRDSEKRGPKRTSRTDTSSIQESRLVSPMRELERDDLPSPLSATPLWVVGRGRVGGSLAKAAELAGIDVRLASRDEPIDGAGAVLLCVPDDAIAAACERVAGSAPLVGHVSGASTLDALAAASDRGASTFSLHPLQTFADAETAAERDPRRDRRIQRGRDRLRPVPGRGARHEARSRFPRRAAPPTTQPRRWPRTCWSRSRSPPPSWSSGSASRTPASCSPRWSCAPPPTGRSAVPPR